jgi:hypothetical protein
MQMGEKGDTTGADQDLRSTIHGSPATSTHAIAGSSAEARRRLLAM